MFALLFRSYKENMSTCYKVTVSYIISFIYFITANIHTGFIIST